MRTHQIIDRLQDDLKIPIRKTHIHFYRKIKLVDPVKLDNGYSTFTDRDYATLVKAVMLTKLGVALPVIKEVLLNKNEDVIYKLKAELGQKEKWISILKEVL
jgi:DNA-binding transcriptional MerR regulator